MFDERRKPVVPVTPFIQPRSSAPYQPFVDARTGRLYTQRTQLFWKTLVTTVEDYVNHSESKFKNGPKIGKLKRRHLFALRTQIQYIGKEADEIEETEMFGANEDSSREYVPSKR